MQRSFLFFSIAILALLAGAWLYNARSPVETGEALKPAAIAAPPGTTYTRFTMSDLDGRTRDFAEWEGRHRLLNFWATWCAPCRREIPLLKSFQEAQGDDGILVMGIAVDFVEDVAAFAEQAEFNYPILVGEQDAMAVAESSGIDFIAMPFTMIVARDGEFLGAYLGELHDRHLESISGILGQLDAGSMSRAAARDALKTL